MQEMSSYYAAWIRDTSVQSNGLVILFAGALSMVAAWYLTPRMLPSSWVRPAQIAQEVFTGLVIVVLFFLLVGAQQ